MRGEDNIIVLDTKTGELRTFPSVGRMIKEIKISRKTVDKALSSADCRARWLRCWTRDFFSPRFPELLGDDGSLTEEYYREYYTVAIAKYIEEEKRRRLL